MIIILKKFKILHSEGHSSIDLKTRRDYNFMILNSLHFIILIYNCNFF